MSFLGPLGGIIMFICAVWVIYDVWTKNNKLEQNMKLIWTIAAVILNVVTAIVYYFMYKK